MDPTWSDPFLPVSVNFKLVRLSRRQGGWNENNRVRVSPHGRKYVVLPGSHVQHRRCRRVGVVTGYGRNRQYMMSCWNKVIVTASLHKICDGPAINLKVEGQIPPKVRRPHNNEAPTRPSRSSSNRKDADDNNQKQSSEGGVFRLHPRLLRSGFALTITCWSAFWTLSLDCPCPAAGRPCRPTNFPVRPRGQPRPGWTEKNVIRIPPRSEYISPSRLDVHCCRSGPRKPCAWELAYGQDMLPGW